MGASQGEFGQCRIITIMLTRKSRKRRIFNGLEKRPKNGKLWPFCVPIRAEKALKMALFWPPGERKRGERALSFPGRPFFRRA